MQRLLALKCIWFIRYFLYFFPTTYSENVSGSISNEVDKMLIQDFLFHSWNLKSLILTDLFYLSIKDLVRSREIEDCLTCKSIWSKFCLSGMEKLSIWLISNTNLSICLADAWHPRCQSLHFILRNSPLNKEMFLFTPVTNNREGEYKFDQWELRWTNAQLDQNSKMLS